MLIDSQKLSVGIQKNSAAEAVFGKREDCTPPWEDQLYAWREDLAR